MPILDKDKVKIYRAGDAVTATVVNDTIDTAINARARAEEAITRSDGANIQSLAATKQADTANNMAQEAKDASANALEFSESARELSTAAESKATAALETVRDLEARANRGEFNGQDGRDGSVATAEGLFGFEIVDGHLMLSYYGEEEPDIAIVDGELRLNL